MVIIVYVLIEKELRWNLWDSAYEMSRWLWCVIKRKIWRLPSEDEARFLVYQTIYLRLAKQWSHKFAIYIGPQCAFSDKTSENKLSSNGKQFQLELLRRYRCLVLFVLESPREWVTECETVRAKMFSGRRLLYFSSYLSALRLVTAKAL